MNDNQPITPESEGDPWQDSIAAWLDRRDSDAPFTTTQVLVGCFGYEREALFSPNDKVRVGACLRRLGYRVSVHRFDNQRRYSWQKPPDHPRRSTQWTALIEQLGGAAEVAKRLGVAHSTAWRWQRTGIPSRHWSVSGGQIPMTALLELAKPTPNLPRDAPPFDATKAAHYDISDADAEIINRLALPFFVALMFEFGDRLMPVLINFIGWHLASAIAEAGPIDSFYIVGTINQWLEGVEQNNNGLPLKLWLKQAAIN